MKIKYKPISKELKAMVTPNSNGSARPSLGLEGAVKEYLYIDVTQLVPYKNQARKIFDEEEIRKLSQSIKQYGIRQPLTIVRSETEQEKFEVISGERRLRAAIQVGLTKVPCIIIKDNEHKSDAIAIIENIHRSNLHPLELGTAYKKLLEKGTFLNISEIAEAVSENVSNISESISLAELPDIYQEQILQKKIVSRDLLRDITRAFRDNNEKQLKKLLGSNTRSTQENFSVLRVTHTPNGLKFQVSGLKKITIEDKIELKAELDKLLNQF